MSSCHGCSVKKGPFVDLKLQKRRHARRGQVEPDQDLVAALERQPDELGLIVERRDQVLIGFDLPSPRVTRFWSLRSTNGPFLTLRPMAGAHHEGW